MIKLSLRPGQEMYKFQISDQKTCGKTGHSKILSDMIVSLETCLSDSAKSAGYSVKMSKNCLLHVQCM